jgi:hypothetical protein
MRKGYQTTETSTKEVQVVQSEYNSPTTTALLVLIGKECQKQFLKN